VVLAQSGFYVGFWGLLAGFFFLILLGVLVGVGNFNN
jgi:hypothetical protein